MIPRTYPSTIDPVSGEAQMVVKKLTSVIGLTRWIDYIPVKYNTNETVGGTYSSAVYVDPFVTGTQAWVDHIPVYEDPAATDAWLCSDTGYIPYATAAVVAARAVLTSSKAVYWRDPSDLSTMFQDSAGTTPVTAVEQPVGLMLDKRTAGQLGSELVTNGTGDSATGWVGASGGSVSASGGNLVLTATGGASFPNIQQTISVTAGKTYVVTVTGTTGTSGNSPGVNLAVGFTPVVNTAITSGQVNRYVLTATGSTATISLLAATGSATAGTTLFDNISVREIPGVHFIQATPASRPTLSSRYNLLTKTEDLSDAVWTKSASGTGSAPVVTPGFLAPDGTMTAWRVQLNRGAGTTASDFSLIRTAPTSSTAAKRRRLWIKSNTGAAQTLSLVATLSADVVTAGLEWAQVSGGSDSGATQFDLSNYGPVPTTQSVDVLIWHPELLHLSDASLPYQRVNTATDYDFDFAKFPPYLRYDGVDDSQASAATVDLNSVVSDGQARRNLLSASEAFDDAAWTKNAATVTANAVTAPDGTTTADTLTSTGTLEAGAFRMPVTSGVHTLTIYAKQATGRYLALNSSFASGPVTGAAWFDLQDGVNVGTPDAGVTQSITAVGNGWHRCSVTFNGPNRFSVFVTSTTTSFASTAGLSLHIWGAQLEAGSTATAYQKTGTDKITVVGAWHKASDAAQGILVETSAAVSSNNGAFLIAAPTAAGLAGYDLTSKGTTTVQAYSGSSFPAPHTAVLSAIGDISGDRATLRVNGVQRVQATGDQGTGNYGNHTLFVGSRAGSSLRFNGREYGFVLFNTTLTATELATVEAYYRAKSRAY